MIRYPLSSPHSISDEAIEAGVRTLRSGRLTMGPQVEAFEEAFARFIGRKYAVMVNSGSSANLVAVDALYQLGHWRKETKVAVPVVAWPTTIWPLVGRVTPVFLDVTLDSFALAPREAERYWHGMPIHVLGQRAAVVERAWHFLIEDCCEACGTSGVGEAGDIATFSHFFSHHLSTVEGGMAVTDDLELADAMRSLRSHGWSRQREDRARWEQANPSLDPRFLFVSPGYNVRPMEVQAAMGLVQLTHVSEILAEKRATSQRLQALLPAWLQVPNPDPTIPWMNLPLIVHELAPASRSTIQAAFEAAGIETRPILAGNILRQPAFQRFAKQGHHFPVADRIMDHGFMMGCHGDADVAVACMQQAFERIGVAA